MTFGDDLRLFAEKVATRQRDVFVGSVAHVHRSVTDGSPTTAAPGQPVDTGHLKSSWQLIFPELWIGEVSTAVEYAQPIEDGVGAHGPLTLRSAVGGFHSVKLTRANWDRVVDEEVTNVTGG